MPASDRRHRIDTAFAEAAERPAGERAAFLDSAGLAPDERAEVEAMLADDAAADDFFRAAADRVAVTADEVTAHPPEHAGPWHPLRLIGRGGMGEVYLAERSGADDADGFRQRAALKLVQPGLAPDLVARFHTERRILAGLEHPGIARLMDGGVASDGRPYLAMEFVDGEPITTYCDRHRLGVDARLRLFEDVCDAVAYAHRRLVVHRDLKPSNVLVAETASGPQVKLLDFGVARLLDADTDATQTDVRGLTPEYAAPEQLRGEVPTTATDVYALGVLLYELLAGQRPFRLPARLAMEAARVVLEESPTDPSTAVGDDDAVAEARATRPDRLRRRLRGDLDRIAQVALRKEPERRYASAEAFGQDVRRHLDGLPVAARPSSVGYRLGRYVRRNRVAVLAAVIGVLGLGAYAATVTVQRTEIARQRDRAEQAAGLLGDLFAEADPYRDEADRDSAITAATPLGDALAAAARQLAARDTIDAEVRSDLLGRLAGTLASLGADSLAREVYATNRRLVAEAFGAEGARYARALRSEGAHRRETAQDSVAFADAERYLRDALALAERVHGPDARETGAVAVELATLIKDTGKVEEAERLAARGVEIARRQREAQTDLETALMIWGLTLTATGDAEGAYEAAAESVEIARDVRGASSVNMVSVLANAALAAQATDRMDQALAYEQEAAQLAVDQLGPEHATTLTVRSNLATTLQQLERYDEAEREHRAILRVRQQLYGDEGFDVGASRNQLGNVLRDAGRLDAASVEYRAAAAAFDSALPETHPVRAIPYVNLAKLDARRGAFADA
ncbi:MAG: serine/threonine-protein kinase, partial [Bacteroidota bacterium]